MISLYVTYLEIEWGNHNDTFVSELRRNYPNLPFVQIMSKTSQDDMNSSLEQQVSQILENSKQEVEELMGNNQIIKEQEKKI